MQKRKFRFLGRHLAVCLCLLYVKPTTVHVTYFVILGGTIDTVVHKIMEDETIVEVYKASGKDWGGTIVDAKFKAFVNELFKNEHCID